MNIEKLIRPNILKLKPYSSARDEYKGKKGVFLDANENSLGSTAGAGLNRYPDPLAMSLKSEISKLKIIPAENIFLGNGSDEAIDLVYRIFCEPGKSNVILCPPTYGMYEVCANINDIKIKKVTLSSDYHLQVEKILDTTDKNTRLIFICSPNNPSANLMKQSDVRNLLKHLDRKSTRLNSSH